MEQDSFLYANFLSGVLYCYRYKGIYFSFTDIAE